jgi:hypothetical protein
VSPPSTHGFRLPGFDEWFAKATNRDMGQRFNSAQEMATALAEVVAGRARGPAPGAPAPLPTVAMSAESAAFIAAVPAQTVHQGSTANALEVRVPTQRRSVVPLLLGGFLVLGVGLGLWLKFGGGKPGDAQAERVPSVDSATSQAASGSAAAAVPGPPLLGPADTDSAPKPSTNSKPTAHASPVEKSAAPEIAEPKSTFLSAPAAANAGAAPSTRPAGRLERCYADPFTGQIRVAGASHSEASFACRQNAFTGAYQRQ